ncbi:Cell division control protein 11 [Rhodotorula toruloides]
MSGFTSTPLGDQASILSNSTRRMAGPSSFAARRKVKGVQLTIMVVGQSGTGRTTFVNTLCEQPLIEHQQPVAPEEAHLESGIRINPVQVELEEDGVRVSLTVVDTPGFGDQIDNEFTFNEIVGYLERQYDDILAEESRIKRNPRFRDNRVHALLYFITPTGHALRELDIELMRRLAPRVNVIPVIGKADSLTPSELHDFKRRVMEDIEYYSIPIYNFPYDAEEDDEDTIQENSELRALMPFAIVGSEEEVEVNGQPVRARRYPWGIVEVDNPQHSDFQRLRTALLQTHLHDVKEITVRRGEFRKESLVGDSMGAGYGAGQDASVNPEDLATQSVRIKEEQLKREEDKLRELELRTQRELAERRQELLAKEELLRSLEARLADAQHSNSSTPLPPSQPQSPIPQQGQPHPVLTPHGGAPTNGLQFPYYYVVKSLFILYLSLPSTRGAIVASDKRFKPLLVQRKNPATSTTTTTPVATAGLSSSSTALRALKRSRRPRAT